MIRAACFMLVSSCALASPAWSADQATAPAPSPPSLAQDLKRLSIEELAELDISSVSRRIERLSQAPAAVSVVRQEDIRRSGVTTLAEAMRLADGIDVARFDGRTWNISARGFNIVTANKLLVLMDGRTLYSPLYAGTYWDVQDTLMADVHRIEAIRGPGGATWGANAVNGVINIITRDASETRGSMALVTTGSNDSVIASARHGARAGAVGSYRVWGKYRRQGPNVFASGASADDPLQLGRMGFRMDADPHRASRWSIQGSAYGGSEALFDRDDSTVRGAFVIGQWSRRFTADSELQLRAYYDHTYRKVPLQFEETRHTVEFDVQQTMPAGDRHDLIVGGNVRTTTAHDTGYSIFSFDPARRTNAVGGVFVQDEITVRPERLVVALGAKLEQNDYTGVEVQPTARVRWSPGDRQTMWGAVSRAVRLPTRTDTELVVSHPVLPVVLLRGNPDFQSESVIAYEAGYRARPWGRIAVDVAGFTNRYDSLRSREFPSALGAVGLLANTVNAATTGLETAVTVQVADYWRVHGAHTYLHKRLSFDEGSRDVSRGADEGNDPSFFFSIRSYLDLPRGLALDGVFRRVDSRPAPLVPAYSSLDVRLGWMARPGWELSLGGQNLLDSSHPEFGSPGPLRYEFERGWFLRSVWHF